MIKVPISYTDYNDNKRTEDCWFHLSKPELMEMNFSVEGGMDAFLKRVMKDEDAGGFIALLKEFILNAYGEKSDDGKSFIKVRNGHRLSEDFVQTPMYEELFMKLINDEKEAMSFIVGLVPKDMGEQVTEKIKEQTAKNMLTD